LDAHYLLELGRFEGRKDQFENAIDDFTEYVKTYPGAGHGWACRATAYERAALDCARRGELAEKEAALTNALADWNHVVTMETTARCLRGDFLARYGQCAAALNDYHRAIELEPANSYPLISPGWFLATCPERTVRNGPLALATLKKGLELTSLNGNEKEVYGLAALAAAYAETGEFSRAVDLQNQALRSLDDAWFGDSLRLDLEKRLTLYQKNRPCHRLLGVSLFD
jgi:tetratricopeptide (TPR) repeat protein